MLPYKMVYQSSESVKHEEPRPVAVVGAGIIGLSCALHLLRRGFSVDVFDRRGPGEGATLGNAGTLAISEVLPFSRPATLKNVPRMLRDPTGPLCVRREYLARALPWLARFVWACRPSEVRRVSEVLASLLKSSNADWRDIVRGTPAEAMLLSHGRFKLYRSAEGLRRAASDIPRQRELGVRVEEIGPAAIREMEPGLEPVFAGALYWPEVSHVTSPLRVARILADEVRRQGGRFHQKNVSRLRGDSREVALEPEDGQTSRHGRVVIAAGAWSRALVRQLGEDVSLDTERGYHVMLQTPKVALTRPVTVTDPGYSLVQMEDGVRLTSGVEFAGLKAPPDFRRIRSMAKHAATVLRGVGDVPISEWLGFRPSMPTSVPVISPMRNHSRVILAFGHGHLGLTMGPTTGRLVAEIITGQKSAIDLHALRPR